MMPTTKTPHKSTHFHGELGGYRQHILQQLLENKSGLCINTLAEQLDISRTAVQQHFRVLEHEGLIKKHDQIKTNGRPLTRYVLTDAGIDYFPKNYLGFSSLMLQTLKNEIGSQGLEDFLAKMGTELASKYQADLAGKPESEQIRMVYELMHNLGFHPQLIQEASGEITELQARNCIYHDLVQEFHEVCSFDKAFMTKLLPGSNGKSMELHNCMANGEKFCCFKKRVN